MRHRLPRSQRLSLLLALTILSVASASTAQSTLETGVYRVRAGAQVLGCGGFSYHCDTYVLEGTLELAVAVPESAGPSDAEPYIFLGDTHLTLRRDGGSATAFPGPENLPLSGLVVERKDGQYVLRGGEEGGQRVDLVLLQVNDEFRPQGTPSAFLLTGLYDEGCCDRYGYQVLGALFEHVEDEGTLLADGDLPARFAVTVAWKDSAGLGPTHLATPTRLDSRSGAFWFYSPDNPEVFVKILDACATEAGSIWVYAAGLTDLEVTLTVSDRLGDADRVYVNDLGRPFQPVLDTDAFDCKALP